MDINQLVAMADLGQAQAPADGGGQPSAAQASEISSKDGWLAPMKFSGTSSEDAPLWWCSFELFRNFKELTNQRALAIFPLNFERWGHDFVPRSIRGDEDQLDDTPGCVQGTVFPTGDKEMEADITSMVDEAG